MLGRCKQTLATEQRSGSTQAQFDDQDLEGLLAEEWVTQKNLDLCKVHPSMGRNPEKLCPWNSLHSPRLHTLFPQQLFIIFDDSGEGLVNLVSFLYFLRLLSVLSFQNFRTCCRLRSATHKTAQFSSDSNPGVVGCTSRLAFCSPRRGSFESPGI